ncbi:MAG: valine--tRNA ligase [Fimbriiglobus sp.]
METIKERVMPIELPKSFDAKQAQEKWLSHWEAQGYFRADPTKPGEPFTIVIPPPNVTGALHMGHALNNTLQDVLIRRKRMQGFNTLWMPGTDHAGIATQAVVERLLLSEDKSFKRREYGRDNLVAKIWEWKEKYEKRILGQLRELGASCDWSRTRFTLDDTCAKAVRETFFRMFRDGYIYRGKRLVNWDTQLQTSVADDETYTETTKGGFWTFQYEVVGQPGTFIQFSTTRPETMLGDTALCVHPDDERYKALIGQLVLQPHTGRKIPIIADGVLAEMELGTGCVKVTPAHDPNDYACWQRQAGKIDIINILNPDGTITAGFGEYSGLDRAKAREAVAEKMKELGLYIDKADRDIPLPYSDRSKTPIEPFLSDQWFVSMGDREDGKPGLAQMAMEAVTSNKVKFFPERYAKTYLDWLGEKRDWCISRQLWWGHQIPIWYKTEPQPTESFRMVSSPTPKALLPFLRSRADSLAISWGDKEDRADDFSVDFLVCVAPGNEDIEKALEADGFTRDSDVLDTWFSSALWPHSTLGWPGETADFKRYYPTSTLCTSRDIITLWVARMVLTGLYNVGDIPFHHVYIHPKIMDGFGEGMSKTKGNGADPLDIIDIYGTDAMRYGMVALATETQDSRMPISNVCPHCGTLIPQKKEHQSGKTKKIVCPGNKPIGIECGKAFRPSGPWTDEDTELLTAKAASDRFELGRNFANKLWNATRFILMNLEGYTPGTIDLASLTVEDRWIVSRLATTTQAMNSALDGYRFAEASRLLYEFTWSEFCDWYIEMSKSRRSDPTCQRVLLGVLDGILRLAHPIMPFVTESLWEALGEVAPERGLLSLETAAKNVCIAPWPEYPASLMAQETETSIGRMQDFVRAIREIRNRYQIDPKAKLEAVMTEAHGKPFEKLKAFITDLGGLANLTFTPTATKPKQSASIVHSEFEARVLLAGLIDPATEAKRLEKQIADLKKQSAGIQAKLSNESFVKNAPPEVVVESREKIAEMANQIITLEGNLADMLAE